MRGELLEGGTGPSNVEHTDVHLLRLLLLQVEEPGVGASFSSSMTVPVSAMRVVPGRRGRRVLRVVGEPAGASTSTRGPRAGGRCPHRVDLELHDQVRCGGCAGSRGGRRILPVVEAPGTSIDRWSRRRRADPPDHVGDGGEHLGVDVGQVPFDVEVTMMSLGTRDMSAAQAASRARPRPTGRPTA